MKSVSGGARKMTAWPHLPTRAVRPTLWTYSSAVTGGLYWTIQSIDDRSSPRAATSYWNTINEDGSNIFVYCLKMVKIIIFFFLFISKFFFSLSYISSLLLLFNMIGDWFRYFKMKKEKLENTNFESKAHTQKKEESILLLNLPSIFWKRKERKKGRKKKKAGLNWIWGYVCTGNRSNEGLQVVRTRGGKRTWRKRGGLRNKFSQMVSVSWIVESHSFCFDWPPLFFSLFFFFSNSPVYPSLELLKRKRFSQFPFTTFSRK